MEQHCSYCYLLKGEKLEEMAQTSFTKMQCLGFSSKRCVGGWLIWIVVVMIVGTVLVPFFLALEKQAAVQRLFPLDEEGKLSCMWWVFPLLYARLEIIFFLFQKAMPHLLCANDLQSMKGGFWVFFHTIWVLGWWSVWRNWPKDQLHGSLFAFFSESKIHISQLIALGETSVPRKTISVSRCGGVLFFLVALQKQNRNERIKCQIDYLIL